MKKKSLVFSLVREQSMFMTAIMSLMTFLAVLALGIALSIGTAVVRWNSQWELSATVQVVNPDNLKTVKNIIDTNRSKVENVTTISQSEMQDLMRPWVTTGATLNKYLPTMYEIKFKSADDMATVKTAIGQNARFLTHAAALKDPANAGWKLIAISGLVLLIALGTIGVCISYIARNTAMLHRRELEILNQIGATDSFVARQMQVIVAKICAPAGTFGFVAATLILLMILGAARSVRMGLMSMMAISGGGWLALMLTPIAIMIFAVIITRKTTLKILKNS